MGWFDTIFGGGQGAAAQDQEEAIRRAMQQEQQYLGQSTGYMQPWWQAGQKALPEYQEALGRMKDPNAFINQMMGGYQQSPFAKFQEHQGIQAANQGAAASGMLGSGAQQKALAQFSQDLSSKDMQQYLQNQMGVWGNYMGGLGGLSGQGMQAGKQMGDWTMGAGRDVAGMEEQIGQARAQGDVANSNAWGNLFGLGVNLLGGGLGAMGMGAGGIGGFGGAGSFAGGMFNQMFPRPSQPQGGGFGGFGNPFASGYSGYGNPFLGREGNAFNQYQY